MIMRKRKRDKSSSDLQDIKVDFCNCIIIRKMYLQDKKILFLGYNLIMNLGIIKNDKSRNHNRT